MKTVLLVVSGIISLTTMYFALQKDIELAKQLPEPELTRMEYDLKDEMVRKSIMDTQQKVEENSEKLDEIDSKLFEIINK
ncbi:MAG: hypothetical protein CMP95_06555 [Gammaproteobacteria bacterium]|nr:hypothetical protein [Gammaproteobacteria bacterium]